MKFNVRIQEFLNGLDPAFSVSTKGVVRDFSLAQLVTVEARPEGIFTYANGGRMSICNEISEKTEDKSSLQFLCEIPGRFTVKTNDIKATLSSFALTDVISVEIKTNKKDTTDSKEDSKDVSEEDTKQESFHLVDGQEIVCTLISDPEQYQTMPCFREYISMPQFVTDFMEGKKTEDAFKVRRDLFVYASNKIIFARGFEEAKPQYMYWIIRATKNSLRFASGSGSLFAVLDVSGDNLSNIKKDRNILIPNEQTQPLLDIVSKVYFNNEFVNFYTSDKWLVIECGSFRAAIAGYEADVKWPNEDDFLNRKNAVVFTTKIGDWANVVKGINATFDQSMKKQHDIHYATLDVNLNKKEIATKTEGLMKSNRKIPIKETNIFDDSVSKNGKFLFTCVSKYIAEAIKNGSEEECIQIEIENSRKPIIFRYHANQKGTIQDPSTFIKENPIFGISEKFSVFFAPKKNQD